MKVSKKKTSSKAVDVIDSFGNLIMVQSELRASELTGVTRSLICSICNKGAAIVNCTDLDFTDPISCLENKTLGERKVNLLS